MSAPWEGRALHFIGIGGAGMSAYARAALALGARVTGSDRAASPFIAGLGGVTIGHAAENVPADAEVVYSSAVPDDNPERMAALARNQRVLSRAQLLGELSRLRRTIAVAGAHGKTTTSAMIVCALRGAGLDPGYLIGGTLRETGTNGDWGSGEWLVIEADESDRSMLSLQAEIAVLTSVELDHHSEFGSLLELEEVYRRFLSGPRHAVIHDEPALLALREGPAVAYRATELPLRVPGAHNAQNAAAALAVAALTGADEQAARDALARFAGTGRRFELLGSSPGGALVYDDYAHHPTEVAATLQAARELAPRRLLAVFQPHLFSRTRELAREFGRALAGADVIAVLDVYPARERAADFPGVSGLTIAEAAADAAPGREILWLPDFAAAHAVLAPRLGEGDLLIAMGAGNVDSFSRGLLT
ncbi:MAG: UDP-N-acetylmuramate--L-alanine ligase [Solirubrobacteraceae bacterium]